MGDTQPHRCHGGGRLVPAAQVIPDDPEDYVWAPHVRCGCNNLRCNACGEPVRWRVADDRATRVYECGCASKEVQWDRWIEDWPADDFTDSVPDWGCAGHPMRTPPFELDGVRVQGGEAWRALAAAAARGEAQPSRRPDYLPDHDLAWLERFAETVSEVERARFDRAVSDVLHELSGEALAALLELVLYMELPEATGRIIESVGTGAARSWLGEADTRRLALKIVQEGAGSSRLEAARAQAMRQLVLSPGREAGGLVWPLAKLDPGWLADHSAEILQQAPERASHLFAALEAQSKVALTKALDVVLDAGAGTRYDLERAIWSAFEEPERSQWTVRLEGYPDDD